MKTGVRGLTPMWVTTDTKSEATGKYQVGYELATLSVGCDLMGGSTLVVLSRKLPQSTSRKTIHVLRGAQSKPGI